jgi:hypothetical protein
MRLRPVGLFTVTAQLRSKLPDVDAELADFFRGLGEIA